MISDAMKRLHLITRWSQRWSLDQHFKTMRIKSPELYRVFLRELEDGTEGVRALMKIANYYSK